MTEAIKYDLPDNNIYIAGEWRKGRGSEISTGTVWINTYKQFSISTPFGADKASGVGREKDRRSGGKGTGRVIQKTLHRK